MKDSLYMLLQYSLENSLDFYSYYDTKTEMKLNATDRAKQGKLLQFTGRVCTVKNNVCFFLPLQLQNTN